MDETLRQILAALFAAHQELAALRQRVADLEAQLTSAAAAPPTPRQETGQP